MRNFIGHIHETRRLSQAQINSAKERIKECLRLDTVEIIPINNEFYAVSTDDSNIIDFKIDGYNNDRLSLVKYASVNDEGKRDNAGALLTVGNITLCK